MEQTQGGPFSSITRPLSVGEYLIVFILQVIPVVNIILLFVWAFSGNTNLNKKNYARAMLIALLILLVLWVILFVVAGNTLGNLFSIASGMGR